MWPISGFTLTAVRKALGDADGRLIRNDPGRGYRLIAEVAPEAEAACSTPTSIHVVPVAAAPAAPLQLPTKVTRIIGRSDFIGVLVAQMPRRRLITIVGPGGIGKTTVAIACAEALAGSYRDGVGFVDLTKVTEAASVAASLARALDVAITGDDPLHDVIEYLKDRQMLLVIDNCEHVIQAAAELVETIIVSAPGVHVLATSR